MSRPRTSTSRKLSTTGSRQKRLQTPSRPWASFNHVGLCQVHASPEFMLPQSSCFPRVHAPPGFMQKFMLPQSLCFPRVHAEPKGVISETPCPGDEPLEREDDLHQLRGHRVGDGGARPSCRVGVEALMVNNLCCIKCHDHAVCVHGWPASCEAACQCTTPLWGTKFPTIQSSCQIELASGLLISLSPQAAGLHEGRGHR